MSNNASGEMLALLPKKLSEVLGDKVHDVLLSLWLGNLELLQEESVMWNESIPWLDREHRELRNVLIRLTSIRVLLSLHSIAVCWTSDGIGNVYRSTDEDIEQVVSEASVTSDLNMARELFAQYST